MIRFRISWSLSADVNSATADMIRSRAVRSRLHLKAESYLMSVMNCIRVSEEKTRAIMRKKRKYQNIRKPEKNSTD